MYRRATLRHKFVRAARRWDVETMMQSSTQIIMGNQHARTILDMFRTSTPAERKFLIGLVLEELLRDGHLMWCWVLRLVTGASEEDVSSETRPVDAEKPEGFQATNVSAATLEWLRWGRRHGYIYFGEEARKYQKRARKLERKAYRKHRAQLRAKSP